MIHGITNTTARCQSKCETGQTCNGKGSCCSNGVGNDGTCCAELTSTDCDTEIDDNGCSVCKETSSSGGCALALAECENWCGTVSNCRASSCYIAHMEGPYDCAGYTCWNGSEDVDCTGGVYYDCYVMYYNSDYGNETVYYDNGIYGTLPWCG